MLGTLGSKILIIQGLSVLRFDSLIVGEKQKNDSENCEAYYDRKEAASPFTYPSIWANHMNI